MNSRLPAVVAAALYVLAQCGCYAAGSYVPAYSCSGPNCAPHRSYAVGGEVGIQYDYRRKVRGALGLQGSTQGLVVNGQELTLAETVVVGGDVTVKRWSWLLLRATGRYLYSLSHYKDDQGPDAILAGRARGGLLGLTLLYSIPDGDYDGPCVDHQGIALTVGASSVHTSGAGVGDHWVTGPVIRLEIEMGAHAIWCSFFDDNCPGNLLRRDGGWPPRRPPLPCPHLP